VRIIFHECGFAVHFGAVLGVIEFTAKPLRAQSKKVENKEKLDLLCGFAVHSGAVLGVIEFTAKPLRSQSRKMKHTPPAREGISVLG